MPLGLGRPSGPNAGPAALLTPFFLTPSVGGGIDDVGIGVPAAAGVLAFGSDGLSPLELVARGSGIEFVDDDSFEGDSPLTGAAGANFCRALGDSFKVTIKLPLVRVEDFRRATDAVEGLLDEAIAGLDGGDVFRWKGKAPVARVAAKKKVEASVPSRRS